MTSPAQLSSTIPASRPLVTGVILAGGQGSRMGGVDKGLQLFRGQRLVSHVIARLAPQVDTLLININRNPDTYATLGYPLITDQIGGFLGPLAGLHTSMSHALTPLVLTAPCDSPCLPPDLLARLLAALQANQAPLAIATTNGRQHPVFCLAHCSLRQPLEDYLAQGGRKFMHWCRENACIEVDFSDEAEAFANFNTLDALDS